MMKMLKILLCALVLTVPALANEIDDRQTATSLKYVTHELDTRQDKLSAGQNKAIEYTDSAGDVTQRTVESDLSGANDSLPTVSAVTDGLSHKQDSIAPINDHTAVTYTGQTGGISTKGIYQTSGTYAEQSDNLIDAKTFNAALKNGLDSEFVCDEDNKQPGTDTCWLWRIHTTAKGHAKNLFNSDDISFNDWSQAIGSSYTSRIQNNGKLANGTPIPVIGGETYILSYGGNNPIVNSFNLYVYNSEGKLISEHTHSVGEDYMHLGYPWRLESNAAYINISTFGSHAQNELVQFANRLQLERGSEITQYEPHVNVYLPQTQQ